MKPRMEVPSVSVLRELRAILSRNAVSVLNGVPLKVTVNCKLI